MDSVGLQVRYCLIEIMRNDSNTYLVTYLVRYRQKVVGYGADIQSIYINIQKEGEIKTIAILSMVHKNIQQQLKWKDVMEISWKRQVHLEHELILLIWCLH